MDLNPSEVFKILNNKGIDTLYHADSVTTSCSLLKRGYLLSRGELEKSHLPMTEQQSDAQDMKFDIWYDVFVDAVDIHARIKARNLYGPVLFCIDASVLTKGGISSIRVTKSNPLYWKNSLPKSDRYFLTLDEFEACYNCGDLEKMFIIPNGSGVIYFDKYLRRVVVDYIKLNGTLLYEQAVEALKSAAKKGGIGHIIIEKRNCVNECKCARQYKDINQSTIGKFYNPSSN